MALFSKKNQVGLYVDSETISVVNGQVNGSSIHIAGFAEMRLPTHLEGDAEAKQRTLEQIRALFSRTGVQSKNILISVPGDGSMTRHFELPVLPKKEERSAVRFEAQKYVPFDPKTLYYDYETYLETDRQKNRVVYFACKKQWVDTLSALLTLAGMKISQVELVSQSIARAFHRRAAKNTEEVTLIIICNDQNTAEIVVQRRGSVLTTRHVPLSRAADGSSLDVPMFVSDVRLSIDYFSENFKDIKLQRLFVATPFYGDTQTLCGALSSELSLPADSGALFEPPANAVSTTGATAAYGLTLGALEKRGARRISLKPTEQSSSAPVLTWEQEKKQLQDLATKEIIAIAVLCAAAFFLIGGVTRSKNHELQRAIETQPKAQNASLSESLGELQNKQTASAQKTAFFNSLDAKRVYLTNKMNELAKIVPPNVRLSFWTYTDELNLTGTSDIVMKIEGYVLSSEAESELSVVNKLVSQLAENTVFMEGLSEIRIVRTAKVGLGDQAVMKFTLDCSKKKVLQ